MTQEVLDFLDRNVSFLATKGTCGNPRVRPIQSFVAVDGKLYSCTAQTKGMYKHMQNFSNVELSAFDGKETWLRIRAEVIFEDNLEVKKIMFAKYPVLKEIYTSAENTDFVVFYYKNPSIKIQSLSGRNEVLKG